MSKREFTTYSVKEEAVRLYLEGDEGYQQLSSFETSRRLCGGKLILFVLASRFLLNEGSKK